MGLKETGVEAGRPLGRPVDPSTVSRWINHGVHGHRLAARRIGGRWCVDREALDRFLEAIDRAAAR